MNKFHTLFEGFIYISQRRLHINNAVGERVLINMHYIKAKIHGEKILKYIL